MQDRGALISSAGGGGFMGGSASSVNVTVKLKPRTERDADERSDRDGPAPRHRRHSGHDDHDARLRRQPAAHARARRRQSGQPPRRRNPRRGSRSVTPHRRRPRRAAEGSARASPIRRSAAKRAGPSWRFASIGPRPPCSASRCRAWPARFARTSAARRPPCSASAARSSPSSSGCAKKTATVSTR